MDIRKFFDTLDHAHLREFLQLRVRDGVLKRLIGKWLKAGVMEAGSVSYPDAGSPQGGMITPQTFYQVVRYVERNALRANLVARAEDWPWSSLRRGERDDPAFPILSDWPLPRPVDWLEIVNQPQTDAELNALRRSVRRGCPLDSAVSTAETAKQLKLDSTLRQRGRPRKE